MNAGIDAYGVDFELIRYNIFFAQLSMIEMGSRGARVIFTFRRPSANIWEFGKHSCTMDDPAKTRKLEHKFVARVKARRNMLKFL